MNLKHDVSAGARHFQIADEQTRAAGFTPTDNFSEDLATIIGFFKK